MHLRTNVTNSGKKNMFLFCVLVLVKLSCLNFCHVEREGLPDNYETKYVSHSLEPEKRKVQLEKNCHR